MPLPFLAGGVPVVSAVAFGGCPRLVPPFSAFATAPLRARRQVQRPTAPRQRGDLLDGQDLIGHGTPQGQRQVPDHATLVPSGPAPQRLASGRMRHARGAPGSPKPSLKRLSVMWYGWSNGTIAKGQTTRARRIQ